MDKNVICAQRLYLDAARAKLVVEGSKAAAFLYSTPGDEIPASAAKQFGIGADGKLKGGKSGGQTDGKSGGKSKGGSSNKEKKPGDNKGGSKPADKGKSAELTDIDGIGPATANALTEAGIADVAALAKVDPASPPDVKTPPNFDWAAVVKAATDAVAKEGGAQ